jgi:hypothetical protein
MEGHLEALLEMDFCTKPPNFGVEAHMEAPAGDALTRFHVIFILPGLPASWLFWPSTTLAPKSLVGLLRNSLVNMYTNKFDNRRDR